jgi:hypothetical protein
MPCRCGTMEICATAERNECWMSPLAERASKVLQHEQRTNHADAAVKPGGLAVFFARWATEARAQGIPQADRLVAMFADYATLDPMQRVARVRAALALLAETAPSPSSLNSMGKGGTRKDTESSHPSRTIPHPSREIPRPALPAPAADRNVHAPSDGGVRPPTALPASAADGEQGSRGATGRREGRGWGRARRRKPRAKRPRRPCHPWGNICWMPM